MKKKILLTSMVTIVLCLCLIAGSTFALFTDRDEFNIAVTSGNVKITAEIEDSLKLSSIRGVADGESNLVVYDPVLNDYFYYVDEPQTGKTFANGGTATIENGNLKLDKLTPGDKVTFRITATNESDVNIKTRIALNIIDGDKELANALKVTVTRGNNISDVDIVNGGFASRWEKVTYDPNNNDLGAYVVTVELPADAGNDFQGMAFNFAIVLEAIQDNAIAD